MAEVERSRCGGSKKGERRGGRKKGTANKATANAREAIARLVDDNADRMQEWLNRIAEDEGPAAAWKCMCDVIEYHIPKLARTELTSDPDRPVIHEVRIIGQRAA